MSPNSIHIPCTVHPRCFRGPGSRVRGLNDRDLVLHHFSASDRAAAADPRLGKSGYAPAPYGPRKYCGEVATPMKASTPILFLREGWTAGGLRNTPLTYRTLGTPVPPTTCRPLSAWVGPTAASNPAVMQGPPAIESRRGRRADRCQRGRGPLSENRCGEAGAAQRTSRGRITSREDRCSPLSSGALDHLHASQYLLEGTHPAGAASGRRPGHRPTSDNQSDASHFDRAVSSIRVGLDHLPLELGLYSLIQTPATPLKRADRFRGP
jgi:hypothetical protein